VQAPKVSATPWGPGRRPSPRTLRRTSRRAARRPELRQRPGLAGLDGFACSPPHSRL